MGRDSGTGGAVAGPSVVRLDVAEGLLWRDGTAVALRAKTLAVLQMLAARAPHAVSAEALRQAVWGGRQGSDQGPKSCIHELRQFLDDDAADPRFIETMGRHGYRLIGAIAVTGEAVGTASGEGLPDAPAGADAPPVPSGLEHAAPIDALTVPPDLRPLVGRDGERCALAAALAAVLVGGRRVVLVAGEAGAGKTRLVDAFCEELPSIHGPGTARLWAARGQGVPHQGSREPYGPLLEALGLLAGGPAEPMLRRLVEEVAPSWLVQLPALFTADAIAAARLALAGSGPERMGRELSNLLERVAAEAPGVLVIEDLQWADASTLAWFHAWCLRRAPARLMVIATLRTGEEATGGAGIGADSAGEAAALAAALRELPRLATFRRLDLDGLGGPAVADYLAARFPGHAFPPLLAAGLAERTEGHALFVAAAVEEWAASGALRREEAGELDQIWAAWEPTALLALLPPSVEAFIAGQVARLLPSERRLLEAASVAGAAFSAALLAEDRTGGVEAAEASCEDLARRGLFIVRAGDERWPDGTLAGAFAFRHALHREALYDRIPSAARAGWHRRVGLRLERAHGEHARGGGGAAIAAVAPVLAGHFERAGDAGPAALYRRLSGEAALDRGAARDAAEQLRAALALTALCPEGPERDEAELKALLALGGALIASEGFVAPGLAETYRRAQTLAALASNPATLAPALYGLWNYSLTRAEIATATGFARKLAALAEGPGGDRMRPAAENAVGHGHWLAGRPDLALPHVERVAALYDPRAHGAASASFGEDPGIVCGQYGAIVHQLLGDAEGAERRFRRGLDLAEALRQPFGMAQVLWGGAVAACLRGDAVLAGARARALNEACERGDTLFWLPGGRVIAGWALAREGDAAGLAQMRGGMAAWEGGQMRLTRPFSLALFAEGCALCGRAAEGRAAAAEARAITAATGEAWAGEAIGRAETALRRRPLP